MKSAPLTSAAESSFGRAKQETALSLGYCLTLPVGGQIENLGYFQVFAALGHRHQQSPRGRLVVSRQLRALNRRSLFT
jgi:hypothetical protein